MKLAKTIAGLAILSAVSGCTSVQQFFNPFYEPPTAQALLGDRNDHALNPSKGGGKSAREALEAMGTYERASLPQPNNPVRLSISREYAFAAPEMPWPSAYELALPVTVVVEPPQ